MSENVSKPRYHVIQEKGWSYVVGEPMPVDSGPWRYEWEAREYADELNRLHRLQSENDCLRADLAQAQDEIDRLTNEATAANAAASRIGAKWKEVSAQLAQAREAMTKIKDIALHGRGNNIDWQDIREIVCAVLAEAEGKE